MTARYSAARSRRRYHVDRPVVQQQLGHSTIATTVDLYSHPGMDLQEKAAQAFDAVLATGRAPEQVGEPATPAL